MLDIVLIVLSLVVISTAPPDMYISPQIDRDLREGVVFLVHDVFHGCKSLFNVDTLSVNSSRRDVDDSSSRSHKHRI